MLVAPHSPRLACNPEPQDAGEPVSLVCVFSHPANECYREPFVDLQQAPQQHASVNSNKQDDVVVHMDNRIDNDFDFACLGWVADKHARGG